MANSPRSAWSDMRSVCQLQYYGGQFSIPIPSFLNAALGIKLTLDPRSHNALAMKLLPIEQGIIKLPGSFFFIGSSTLPAQYSDATATVS
ncbi:hypothetical protein V6N13_148476 [Hibiscus sabdariffa]